jgi:hypothetical protein
VAVLPSHLRCPKDPNPSMAILTTGQSEEGVQVPQIMANTIFGRPY